MRMRIAEAIKKMPEEEIAKIIGAAVLMRRLHITEEEAMEVSYIETARLMQEEIEVDYEPTHFDWCCESMENMAQSLDIVKVGWTKEQIMEWLKQGVEKSGCGQEKGLKGLVNINIKTYYEIRDSELYGGEGSVGYSMIELERCKALKGLTEERLEALNEDAARMCGVTVDKVRMIDKEEYEARIED